MTMCFHYTPPDQPDPEDAICATCGLPYRMLADTSRCEEHAEYWCEVDELEAIDRMPESTE